MKKKILTLFIALCLIVASSTVAFAVESEENQVNNTNPISKIEVNYLVNMNLTDEQVAQRFQYINSSYQIGQPFSKEDTEFVRAYAYPAKQMSRALSTQNIENTVNSGGFYGRITGTVFTNLGVTNHSFGGNLMSTATGGTINKINIWIQCTAYGIVGSDGLIGLVYNKTISGTGTQSPTYFNSSQPFTAGALYTSVVCGSTITYNSGSTLTVPGRVI